jgi:2-dehydropantoate 2-reductase
MVNVLIYGAGAIGSFVGYLLSETVGTKEAVWAKKCRDEHDRDESVKIEAVRREASKGDEVKDKVVQNVALLGRKGHIQSIKESGLKISTPDGPMSIQFDHAFSTLNELEISGFKPDLIVVCVKTYSLPEVRSEIMSSDILKGCFKGSVFILLMNGMGNREALDLPIDGIYEGFTSLGAVFFDDGVVDLKGIGTTFFEEGIPVWARSFIRERFHEKGFQTEFSPEFKRLQWNKLFVNAVANPISAITRKKNEATLSVGLEETLERVVDECLAVARLEGMDLERNNSIDFVRFIISKNAANTSSMLQDVLKGKSTEIDSINGYVVRLAKKHGVEIPVNETLYALVKSIEGTDSSKA